MKVLVIGGAGYLGSVLVPILLAEDCVVTVLDNMLYGENSLAMVCQHPGFDFHRVDARDVQAVKPFLHDADVVIPLAGLVGAPLCNLNPVDAELLNIRAHLDLFDYLSPDQLVINPSTESVYGRQPGGALTEESPVAPLVSYGVHKLTVERALEGRDNSISFRMATLFGMSPRMRLDLLINDFTWRALKDRAVVVFEGSAMRTCLHVIDAARAFVHFIGFHPIARSYGVYNVGSITLSKLELCAAIKLQVPEFHYVEAQYATDPDARDYVVSDAKLRATGYAPTVSLKEGIAELLKGYKMLDNNRYSNMP